MNKSKEILIIFSNFKSKFSYFLIIIFLFEKFRELKKYVNFYQFIVRIKRTLSYFIVKLG